MKTRFVLVCFLLLLVLSLTSCFGPGLGDWEYKLPNGYEVWRINGSNIIIGLSDGSGGLISVEDEKAYGVDAYVMRFCMNDRYVAAQQINAPDDPQKIPDKSYPRYYIIDTLEQMMYGPYSEDEYSIQCDELKITELGKWIDTYPAPEGAIFPE